LAWRRAQARSRARRLGQARARDSRGLPTSSAARYLLGRGGCGPGRPCPDLGPPAEAAVTVAAARARRVQQAVRQRRAARQRPASR
jgi:hypothetical protein